MTTFDISQPFCEKLTILTIKNLNNNTYYNNALLHHKIFNWICCVVNNKSELLPVVSGFKIFRPCPEVEFTVHVNIVVHRLGMISHIHIAVCGVGGIGLKYRRSVSNSLIGFRGETTFGFFLILISIPCQVLSKLFVW